MNILSHPVLRSYVKTALAAFLLFFAALLFATLGFELLPKFFNACVVVLGGLVGLAAATIVSASAIVLIRYRRGALGQRDLFLELNRSRDAAAIKTAQPQTANHLRRWLTQRLLGHALVVGDLVEIKPWPEICATLDERGCLEQLPFMREMLSMCGQRAHVFRCAHRLFDYRKTRRMRHMDGAVLLVGTVCSGSDHGGCEAACHTIWKAAWLRRVDPNDSKTVVPASPADSGPHNNANLLQHGTEAPRYACQLTQLHDASRPIGKWSAANFLRPLIAGNVVPTAFLVGWLTHVFNQIQYLRGGADFPTFEPVVADTEKPAETLLRPGDQVVVRSSAEIRATLNDQLQHRGLWLEPDMLKHCGRRYCVHADVKRIVDIVSGEMITMKTPAYTLRDIHFSGERQLFNAQYEPLFWRSAWLRPDRN